ncbi:MAG: TonB-dependent receptor plug domain-containing protein [Bacteroidaceae bacterium]|nr:TonB-dependent receptor plug domain-containing protein [Bacteroidaceae bacterium]
MKRARLLATLFVLMLSVSVLGQGVERVKDSGSKTSYNNIIDMLRGEPSLTIMGTGDDGTMPSMYIRGIGTNSKNFQPLFVVDGLRTENILYVQPCNVHSITIIKDGTSSIYGMEGANGVIEIRTKAAVEAEKKEAEEKKVLRKKTRKFRLFKKRNEE